MKTQIFRPFVLNKMLLPLSSDGHAVWAKKQKIYNFLHGDMYNSDELLNQRRLYGKMPHELGLLLLKQLL